ncbi:MAG TPA: hypothetical protein VD736_09210 [Nitrososphaera sp.]|nr:hypothetical protein [Nitrososphaera sp.]
MIRRNNKEELLTLLEDWINEVVAKYADGHNGQIPNKFIEGFKQSIQANIGFHKEMADNMNEADDPILAKYHNLMSEMYKKFICE